MTSWRMRDGQSGGERVAASPRLHLFIGLAIIPVNFEVWLHTVEGVLHRPDLPYQIAFVLLAAAQLALGISAGVSGGRSWRGSRRIGHLALAAGGWFVALGAVGGWLFGINVPPFGRLYL
jgi:hypothetical protein